MVLSVLALTIAMGGLLTGGTASAVPSAPTDESKVPHYFGPYPNWANSPLALPDAQVVINGNYTTQAKAEATVGANGAITGITVTDGGSGYTQASIVITGSGTGATAKANIMKKGAVVDIKVGTGGSGYTAPTVSFSGGGAGTGAAATAYGGVEQVDDHQRRERLHVPDGGLRPAGRAERRPSTRPRRDGRERDDHGRCRSTTPDRDTRSLRASPSATERCSTRSR